MYDKNVFINFSNPGFNYFHNDMFEMIVKEYLEKNPDLEINKLVKNSDLAKTLEEVLGGNLNNVVDTNALYHTFENIYDFWRDHKRYLFADLSVSHSINSDNYIDVFQDFNDYILSSYRRICTNLLGKKFSILRELPAGGNAFVLLDKANNCVYPELKDVRFISNVIFRPPFVVYSKSNKRTGVFPIIDKNPLEGINLNADEWFCFPILVGNAKTYVYFKERYMSMGLAISNLFEHFDAYKDEKPDSIIVFGTDTVDGVYYDKENNIYIGSLVECDKIDYFGYMKKIILTVYNIMMINKGNLPIHGAGVSITLKDHSVKNVVLMGDSGAGKSETLEALRVIAKDYIVEMTTIFDDMGTFVLTDEGLKAYGTEIGAFVRTDDMENGYTYKVFDRAIFMNPNQVNARLVLPISTHDDIVKGFTPDIFMYANNYDESEQKITLFQSKKEALETFVSGKRMAKGTTSEMGLVETYFANPFGPVQMQKETDILLDKYFDYMFENDIAVGTIHTGLGLPDGAKNPVLAAEELLERLKGGK